MDSTCRARAVLRPGALVVLGLAVMGAAPGGPSEEQRLDKVPVGIERALRAVEARGGRPVSAGYVVRPDDIQLSVYAVRRGRLVEVMVDGATGRVLGEQALPAGHERNAAESEALVMRRARVSLRTAVARATAAAGGLRVVGISPAMDAGRPVAWVTVLDGTRRRQLIQRLDGSR